MGEQEQMKRDKENDQEEGNTEDTQTTNNDYSTSSMGRQRKWSEDGSYSIDNSNRSNRGRRGHRQGNRSVNRSVTPRYLSDPNLNGAWAALEEYTGDDVSDMSTESESISLGGFLLGGEASQDDMSEYEEMERLNVGYNQGFGVGPMRGVMRSTSAGSCGSLASLIEDIPLEENTDSTLLVTKHNVETSLDAQPFTSRFQSSNVWVSPSLLRRRMMEDEKNEITSKPSLVSPPSSVSPPVPPPISPRRLSSGLELMRGSPKRRTSPVSPSPLHKACERSTLLYDLPPSLRMDEGFKLDSFNENDTEIINSDTLMESSHNFKQEQPSHVLVRRYPVWRGDDSDSGDSDSEGSWTDDEHDYWCGVQDITRARYYEDYCEIDDSDNDSSDSDDNEVSEEEKESVTNRVEEALFSGKSSSSVSPSSTPSYFASSSSLSSTTSPAHIGGVNNDHRHMSSFWDVSKDDTLLDNQGRDGEGRMNECLNNFSLTNDDSLEMFGEPPDTLGSSKQGESPSLTEGGSSHNSSEGDAFTSPLSLPRKLYSTNSKKSAYSLKPNGQKVKSKSKSDYRYSNDVHSSIGSKQRGHKKQGQVYDLWLYIQMQYCSNNTLRDHLDMREGVDIAHALHIFIQIARGLEYVHGKDMIHRDLKPSNCFFMGDGTVKVGDFGLSRSAVENMNNKAGVQSRSNSMDMDDCSPPPTPQLGPQCSSNGCLDNTITSGIGTMLYASPEQIEGGDYDAKTVNKQIDHFISHS